MKNINIHKTSTIGKNVVIDCKDFVLGKNSVIKDNCTIKCTSFKAEEGLYMCEGVEVGRGGCYGPNSRVNIGKNVGIGADVMIWTHGAWLDVTQGFPSDFGPVKIGNNVWLPARSVVLPNVTIGDDTVVGIGSIINRDLPSGCLAAGSPCKVIKENCYPKELNNEELQKKILEITNNWCKLHKDKNITNVSVNCSVDGIITLKETIETTIYHTHYDVIKKEMIGCVTDASEDLRDYLRRRGIKIYTNKPFTSIKSKWLEK